MPTGYYKKNKQKLQKEACESYQNLSEDDKQKYCYERYRNLSEDKKPKLIEYGRDYGSSFLAIRVKV